MPPIEPRKVLKSAWQGITSKARRSEASKRSRRHDSRVAPSLNADRRSVKIKRQPTYDCKLWVELPAHGIGSNLSSASLRWRSKSFAIMAALRSFDRLCSIRTVAAVVLISERDVLV